MKLPLLLRLMWVMLSNNSALKGQIPLDVSIQWIPLHLLRGRRYKGFLARDTISMIEVNRIHNFKSAVSNFSSSVDQQKGGGVLHTFACYLHGPIANKPQTGSGLQTGRPILK
uniref:Secreted protein n=1 Tax=Micrurus spixii TaxID=129469 RepID=A0A2D4M348_9SAUR